MKRACSLILAVLLLGSILCIPVFAEEEPLIMPMANNVAQTATLFTISSSGKATVNVKYIGFAGVTTHAKITTHIERKTLGLIWTKVDIGTTNKQWVDNPKGAQFSTSHSTQLSKTGQYRAVVTYTIYGSGGAADVIPCTIVKNYK